MSGPTLYRIYCKRGKENHRLLGTVDAVSLENALEKARNGVWKQTFVDLAREDDTQNWVAMN